jgi:hypothetical protein
MTEGKKRQKQYTPPPLTSGAKKYEEQINGVVLIRLWIS